MARFDILGLQYFTDGGELLGGGKLNFYETGTTTRKNTFSDAAMTIANTNPVTLDADGRAPNIFFAGLAKCVLTDSTGAILETRDPVGDDSASKNGFPDWAADVTYSFNQPVTGSDGYIYTSLVNNNIGNDPISSPSEWQLLAQTIGIPDTPNGNVLVIDTSADLGIGSISPAALQSLVFIETKTISNQATVDITDLDEYSQYVFEIKNVQPATSSAELYMRTSSNNGVSFNSTAGDYDGGVHNYLLTTGTVEDLANNDFIYITGTTIPLPNAIGAGYSGTIKMTKQASEQTSIVFTGGYIPTTGGCAVSHGYALRDSTTQVDAVRFYFNTGNLSTGSITVYGLKT